MNLGKIKFEKINMKIVVGIGISIIALLTALFIIFRTNLIIKNKDGDNNKKPNTEHNENTNGSNNQSGESGNSSEGDSTESGLDGNSGESGNNSGNSETGSQTPNYDDPEEDEEGEISSSVKKRTKKAENLTTEEKEYILQDNVGKVVKKEKGLQTGCVKDSFCALNVKDYTSYSSDDKIGKKIKGCSGYIIFYYDEETDEIVYDMQEVKCK